MSIATARMIRDEVFHIVPWVADAWGLRDKVKNGLYILEKQHHGAVWWLRQQQLSNYDWIILALESESDKERFRERYKRGVDEI